MRNVLFIGDKLISTILSYLPLQTKPQISQAFRFAIATKVVLTIYSFAKYARCTASHCPFSLCKLLADPHHAQRHTPRGVLFFTHGRATKACAVLSAKVGVSAA